MQTFKDIVTQQGNGDACVVNDVPANDQRNRNDTAFGNEELQSPLENLSKTLLDGGLEALEGTYDVSGSSISGQQYLLDFGLREDVGGPEVYNELDRFWQGDTNVSAPHFAPHANMWDVSPLMNDKMFSANDESTDAWVKAFMEELQNVSVDVNDVGVNFWQTAAEFPQVSGGESQILAHSSDWVKEFSEFAAQDASIAAAEDSENKLQNDDDSALSAAWWDNTERLLFPTSSMNFVSSVKIKNLPHNFILPPKLNSLYFSTPPNFMHISNFTTIPQTLSAWHISTHSKIK